MIKRIRSFSPMGNNKGSAAIVLAVMILVVVSLIGIQASSTSSLEVQLASAERTAKQLFYKAEGAAMKGGQEIENAEPEVLNERSEEWLNKEDDVNLLDVSQWDYDGLGSDDTAEELTSFDDGDDKTYFGVTDKGIPKGSSLHMGHNTQLHSFRVFGRCVAENQGAFIEMGYKRRY